MTPGGGERSGPDLEEALPFVDEHTVEIAAPREAVWRALEQHLDDAVLLGPRHPLAAILGTDPPAGFERAAREEGRRLALAGRHRFSRYRLTFLLEDGPAGGTRLRARTDAAFPGLHGRLYRAAVIGTGGHRIMTRRLLQGIRRRALGAR